MKTICSFAFFFVFVFVVAQDGYPVPEKTPARLFYIQHSQNHNTYVYDVNMNGTSINREDPVYAHRIVYTEGGVDKPLTGIQKRMAYGIEANYVKPGLYEMYLAATKKQKLYLTLNAQGPPRVYTTVNNHKIYVDRMFIKLKDSTSGIGVHAEYVLFEGQDFDTGENVTEKMEM
ncbi:DUF4833 domain-containing protein [Sinomicrobium weinanense]|uniref:DUF4833 domain-containing protein n=1 Tax=Sinomicrobium weinanense TaxID=2842200 RepID=A0A926JU04_9FLAO|nr:DUF4833 domain-containing protein [Sinomicrobium weinanense]MBC9797507.1 DUF4833 domain-containing protein [Sinomicrobium weinanense]MBU3122207.1 DUF4833 domain-containing protein [Sinomicrobium weinanense]